MDFDYKAWIPTNNGELSKARVANSYPSENWKIENDILTLTQTNSSDYSDTVFYKKNELLMSYKLLIDFDKKPWEFKLSIDVGNVKNLIKANGTINTNGIIEFSLDVDKKIEGNPLNLSNTIFTMVKNCVHGDGHHEQKVDKFIPVQENKKFKYSNIAKQLANHIKQNEFEAKRLFYDKTTNAHQLSVVNGLNGQAKGFKSYYDAFLKNFKDEIEKEKLPIGCPDSVLLSLESIKNKLEIESTNNKFLITVLFSVLAFFMSANILIKPVNTSLFLEKNHLLFFLIAFSISILILISIDLRYIGVIKETLAPFFKAKEYYQRKYIYGNNKKKYNFEYVLGRFGPFVFAMIFAILVIFGIYFGFNLYTQNSQYNFKSATAKKENNLSQSTKIKSLPKYDKNISKK